MIGYRVNCLSPSSDAVPHNGQLYAATVTVEGLGGWATPLVPLCNARAESGDNYRVIAGGVAPAPPGGSTTGKLYFDVVGDVPNSVVYNDGTQDLLVWVPAEGACLVVVAPRTSQASPPRSSATHPPPALSLEETWRRPRSSRPPRKSIPSRLLNNMQRERAGKRKR